MLGLLALQFVLGVADVILLAPTWMQIVHLLGADLYWVTLVVVAAGVVWPVAGKPVWRVAGKPTWPVAAKQHEA